MNKKIQYTKNVTLSADAGQWFSFEFIKINSLIFSSFGGFPNGFMGIGSKFTIGNVTNSVSEPGTTSLMIMAFAGLAGIAALKKQRAIQKRI